MATWPPKSFDGDAKEMQRALASLASPQGHVTGAKNNLAATLDQDELKAALFNTPLTNLNKK